MVYFTFHCVISFTLGTSQFYFYAKKHTIRYSLFHLVGHTSQKSEYR